MKNIKSFICGMLVMGVMSCVGAYATDVWQNINVLPNTIKVVVDGRRCRGNRLCIGYQGQLHSCNNQLQYT